MYPASIKPDQPSLDRKRRPGELSLPARYASIQRVPTGIRAVSDPQLVGHRLAMELFENPRGGTLGGPFWGPPMRGRGPTWWSSLDQRSLDDKTDLNRRMNETLEAIARAI